MDAALPAAETLTKGTRLMSRLANRKAPAAFVSLWAPAGRRRWWWYSYRCGQCGRYQLGRASTLEDVTGIRTAGCGHRVTIAIARIYGRAA
jgi:DNA-directed RNA polymerase subunit RPC12/RpoP